MREWRGIGMTLVSPARFGVKSYVDPSDMSHFRARLSGSLRAGAVAALPLVPAIKPRHLELGELHTSHRAGFADQHFRKRFHDIDRRGKSDQRTSTVRTATGPGRAGGGFGGRHVQ